MYSDLPQATSGSSAGSALIIVLVLAFSIYFLPSIIALAKRNHRTKVILFNFFLGWTFVLWIISLVWACKRDEEEPITLASGASVADELKKYKDLLDSGAITQEEFEEKKEQLLHR